MRTLVKVSPWFSRYNSFVMTCRYGMIDRQA
jgi:hypothetical protein